MSASASYTAAMTVKLCSEKTLDMPFLAYYGCSKLLKARAVFYWGAHTRFTYILSEWVGVYDRARLRMRIST